MNAEDPPESPSPQPTGKLLCIEDDETSMVLVEVMMKRFPDIQLTEATNGADGIRLARAERPDLVLLDMHLPDMSGLDLLRHLKADPATATVPVIVVSADATAQQVDAALDAGAVRYLTKPVGVIELLSTVDDLLDRMDTRFS